MPAHRCVVVILTYNSESIIEETVTQALKVSSCIYVVDSASVDSTREILLRLGCTVVQRAFKNYSDQRNWAIEQVTGMGAWQLHLDADEVLDKPAIEAIVNVLSEDPKAVRGIAYLIKRRDYFMGKELRFSGLNPWHLRLFPSNGGKCEERLYDQHFLTELPVKRLPGYMHDKNALALSDWIARHNRWSDLEADQALRESGAGELQPEFSRDPRKLTRLIKKLYYTLPPGLRSVTYFVYRYFVRGGFLDGRVGFYFALFQGLWFRTLVDAKINERLAGSQVSKQSLRSPIKSQDCK